MINQRVVPQYYPFADVPIIAPSSMMIPWTSLIKPDVRDNRFAQLCVAHIKTFIESFHFKTLSDDDKSFVRSLVPEDAPSNMLLPTKMTDLTTRLEYMEQLRSTIPAAGILEFLLKTLATGQWPDGAIVSSADRAKIAMRLFDKSLPDAKNIDSEVLQEKAIRSSMATAAINEQEIRKLSRSELILRLKESES